jgi:small GTP-binding protein
MLHEIIREEVELSTTANEKSSEYHIKCIVLGDPGVGKSSILERLVKNRFSNDIPPTVCMEFRVLYGKIIDIFSDKRLSSYYKIQLWDCAGQDRFRSIVKSYFRGAHLIFVIFDLSNRESFLNLEKWFNDLYQVVEKDNESLTIILFGNKTDIHHNEITEEEIQKFCKDYNVFQYFEGSARNDVNILDSFERALLEVHYKVMTKKLKPKQTSLYEKRDRIQLDSNNDNDFAKSGCLSKKCF